MDKALTLTIVADVAVALSDIPEHALLFREGRTHKFNIGKYMTQSTPPTTEWSVAETTDTHNAISSVGLAVTADKQGAGSYNTTVTLGDSDGIDKLWLQFTAESVDDDRQATVTLTGTDP